MGNFKWIKIFLGLFSSAISFLACGQNVTGKYLAPYGHKLEIRKDSSFYLEYYIGCTVKHWQQGVWSSSGDTIVFQPKPVYDTLCYNSNDSIILSTDLYSNKISYESFDSLTYLGTYQINEQTVFKVIRINHKLFYIGSNGEAIRKEEGQPKVIVIGKERLDGSGAFIIRYRRKYSAEFKVLTN
jgi:hypothetical protein